MNKGLNIGDYVRTKKGTIYKFNSKSNMAKNGAKKYMVKSSPNIIDLIEVGDYLNGFRVNEIERDNTNTIIKIGNSTFNVLENEEIYTPSNDNNNGYTKIEKLKSIVTKEQFESMEYKVGDKENE